MSGIKLTSSQDGLMSSYLKMVGMRHIKVADF